MTNATAVILATMIFAGLAVDYIWYDFANFWFLFAKFDSLLEWIAFWR